jgi:DNA topoisomerase-3
VTSCQLEEKYTGPPDYLTESDLITLMEKHGIGTDASIPVHINNIVQRNYVQLVSGRKLEPTELGVVLVHGYKKIDPDLVKPQMRASVENQLDLIAAGKTEFKTMVDYVLNIMLRKFHYFVDHINMMDSLMETKFTSLRYFFSEFLFCKSFFSSAGKPFSKCGKCRRFIQKSIFQFQSSSLTISLFYL